MAIRLNKRPDMNNSSPQLRYRVSGMDCGSCASKIETAVRRVAGVSSVTVSVTAGTMAVQLVGSDTSSSLIEEKVTALGYKLTPLPVADKTAPTPNNDHACTDHDHNKGHSHEGGRSHKHEVSPDEQRWWQGTKAKLIFVYGAALAAACLASLPLPDLSNWFYGAALLLGLAPITRRAWIAAASGTPFSIETLMSIAAVGALAIGATQEAAVVILLFLVGELLEGVAASRSRASIKALTALMPKTAFIEHHSEVKEVPADSLAPEVIIIIRPGDRVPADGLILSGESAIDEAPISGESVPKNKKPGENVFAGTVNLSSVLRVQITAAASDNTIARIIRLVEEAQESKAPTERFIDQFSSYYTPAIVIVAALVATVPPLALGAEWGVWIYKALALLLIGCPCALVISTPAAIAAGLAAGARQGLLIKGGSVLERLGGITHVAFDKTGTLTEGKPQVTDIVAFSGNETDVLRLASALEAGSSHPLAKAILARAEQDGIKAVAASNIAAASGKGMTGQLDGIDLFLGSVNATNERVKLLAEQLAQTEKLFDEGKTVSVLVADSNVKGLIAMRDEPRPDAKAGIARLDQLGIKTVMLTGDNQRTATAIGKLLGMEVRGGLLPADKLDYIQNARKSGQRIAKVGDGINDAPALAAAEVGIAMGGGTDVALETAEAALMYGKVSDVGAMVELSRRTMRNIHQNIVIALGLKVVFLVTTLIGITGLWPAILADTGATVLVTLNALRLLKISRTTS
jgi:Cd2+/Zn2+-exporting ATPase